MRLTRSVFRRYRYRNAFTPAEEVSSGLGKYTKDFANLPERYVARKSAKIMYKSEDHPAYVPRLTKFKAEHHNFTRPWTTDYWRENKPDFDEDDYEERDQPDYVQPIRDEDWMWFRGDRVELLTGKDKGKQGYICYIVQERNWVYVEGLNCKKVIEGKDNRGFPGSLRLEEKPLLVTTDIKLVDPSDEQACEVEWRYTEDGQRVRSSTRTGYLLPVPSEAFQTRDYKTKAGYKDNPAKDTKATVVEEVTFEPKLATFDMDLMKEYGIEEDRVPRRTFFY